MITKYPTALTNIRYILPSSYINDDGIRYSVAIYKKANWGWYNWVTGSLVGVR